MQLLVRAVLVLGGCSAAVLGAAPVSAQTFVQAYSQEGAAQAQGNAREQGRELSAQEKRVRLEFIPSLRFDLIAGSVTAGHVGLGMRMQIPGSNYFSLGGTAAIGGSESGLSGRWDAFGRFSLDPYHYATWEPYIGAGVTVRSDAGAPGTRTYLLGFVGLDGPKVGQINPGVEIGVGGGFRLGVTLRFAQ